MDALFYKRVSLVVLFKQHLQTAGWHAKHIRKLSRIDRWLFSREHSRFGALQFFYSGHILVAVHPKSVKLSLLLFVLNVLTFVVLPFVVDLLVDQAVSLF